MRELIFIPFLFISFNLYSQVEGIVLNKETKEPIPYANIWMADEEIGTTSDTSGRFSLAGNHIGKFLIISAIGFESIKIQIDSEAPYMYLKPKTYLIREIQVTPRLNKEFVDGSFRRSQVYNYNCPRVPLIYARFFPFKEEYGNNPIIKSIKIATYSKIHAKINIRIFNVLENGQPGDDLLTDNYFVSVRKGRKTRSIDISDAIIIPFPRTGVFIAIEFLIIDENKYIPKTARHLETNQIVGYMPFLGVIESDEPERSWMYFQGTWQNKEGMFANLPPNKKNTRNYAIEITIEN